jgi:hypothetical protein
VHSNFVAAQARIEYWLPILKSNREAESVAVILDALGYAADGEYDRGTYHHGMIFSHPALPFKLNHCRLATMHLPGTQEPSQTSSPMSIDWERWK